MNSPVSFEIAKLLKEKGFKMTAGNCYYNEEFYPNQNLIPLLYPELKGEGYKERVTDKIVFAPTITEVVMWFYEKHGVWVYVKLGYGHEYVIQSIQVPFKVIYSDGTFKSPTEAYEAVIEYTLKHLI